MPSAAPPSQRTGRGRARCPPRARTVGSATTDRTRSIGSVTGGWRTTVTPPSRQVEVAGRRVGRSEVGPGRGRGQRAHDGRRATRCGGRTRPDRPSARPPSRPASTSAGGGPQPSHDFSGSTATPAGVPTSSSTTQPRTVRPWKGARTRVPTCDVVAPSPRAPSSRTSWPRRPPRCARAPPVRRAPPCRPVSRNRSLPCGATLPSGERSRAQSPKAVRRSSTRGVASHVNSFSERPKCP